MVIIVFGLPGSGKSFLAKRLADEIGAVHLSTDVVRNEMSPIKDYSLLGRKRVYDLMLNKAKDKINVGADVVLDGTFYLESLRELIKENLKKNTEIHYIEIVASEELIKKRTEETREDSDADFQVYMALKQAFEPMKEPHLRLISTDSNISQLMNEAMEYIALNEKKV